VPATEIHQNRASPEDIVRYLRQQDDVVVPDGESAFLVNGRFRLGLSELVQRANKMRLRQGKAEFRLSPEAPVQSRVRAISTSRHTIFWEEKSPSERDAAQTS